MTAADVGREGRRVLILDGSIHRDIYRPADHWRALLGGVPSVAAHLPSGERPSIDGFSHVIVTGSEASITERAPWYEVAAGIIRRAVEREYPVLGSCFGHQLLVRTLSGERYVRSSPSPEAGWARVRVTGEDELTRELPSTFAVFVSHFDEVHAPPDPWRVLGANDACPAHVIRYGTLPVWGFQSHPEISPDEGRRLLAGLKERIPDKAGFLDRALTGEVADDRVAPIIVERFLTA